MRGEAEGGRYINCTLSPVHSDICKLLRKSPPWRLSFLNDKWTLMAKEPEALPAMEALVSIDDESAHGPHTVTQRDPGLAAKRRQPANSTSSASIKHGHVLRRLFFPLFPSSIPTRKNSLGPQTRNLNITCIMKADAVFWTRGNDCRDQKSNLLCIGYSSCDLHPNLSQNRKGNDPNAR